MAQSLFQHLKIAGISTVVPADEIRLEDELQYFGGNSKKAARVTKIVGIDRRRVASHGITAADLCQQAAETLLAEMVIDPNSIDALIFISQGPDHFIPATACILQHKLGLSKDCAAFDVNQGCTGFVYGLWLAGSLIESRACSRVLLLVGESLVRLADTANRIVTPVFGDCGTATLLEYNNEPSPAWFELGTDGSGAEALMVPTGGARVPFPTNAAEYEKYMAVRRDPNGTPWRLMRMYMDGGAIFDFTLNRVPGHLSSLLAYAGKKTEEIDWVILHQANKQIIQAIAEKTGFDLDKVPWNTFSTYGNQAGASIPSAICHMVWGSLQEGPKEVLLSGYGVGLSWASAILTLRSPWCSGVRDYVLSADHVSPEEFCAKWIEKITGQPPEENEKYDH